jgi:hypothetical protein
MFLISLMLNAFPYSGVDVIALLESLSISEKVINPLRDSSAGYIALAYALYKIATPIRYTVTLGMLYQFPLLVGNTLSYGYQSSLFLPHRLCFYII